ncbi:MAG: AAA family ATPase [Armatimonadetes bacterium]|nr:AAA family ATPase [Armatimonadota bacterium]
MSPFDDGLSQFLDVLPALIRERLERSELIHSLVEVVLDYGRPAEVRYRDKVERMPDVLVSQHDLDFVSRSIGDFGSDNRAGIERTLHRISAIRNRHGKIIGLTCRVGRALEGTIDIIDGIVRSGQSILFLGRPGIGKTTKLREVARVLADEVGRRVVIVDTSNEIAGDGDVPHPAIGSARRMQVRHASEQHQVMVEAVENHMPEVIIIDEIGTEMEAAAARTIAERGVQLVGTAHGQTLENLMLNPTLCDLIGGIQAVTLSDAEAARRGTQKTVLERKAPPTFDVVIELLDYDRLAIHHDVQKTVDLILKGVPPRPEIRVRTGAGSVEIVQAEQTVDLDDPGFNTRFPALARQPRAESPAKAVIPAFPSAPDTRLPATAPMRVFLDGIAPTRVERAIREKRINAVVVKDPSLAEAVLAIRANHQGKSRKARELMTKPTVIVKSNTFVQVSEALEQLVKGGGSKPTEKPTAIVEETLAAIDAVLQSGKPLELPPQPTSVRKIQHQVTEAKKVMSESVGEHPNRRVRILPSRLM